LQVSLPVHALAPPQVQAPPAQPSAVPSAVQSTHVTPAVPQLAALDAVHVVPAQQPPAHDMASHTHTPPLQR
jgi:hypothetical protein